jgi:hypothetical protein
VLSLWCCWLPYWTLEIDLHFELSIGCWVTVSLVQPALNGAKATVKWQNAETR